MDPIFKTKQINKTTRATTTTKEFFRTRKHQKHTTTCGTTPHSLYVNGPPPHVLILMKHISVAVILFLGCVQLGCASSSGNTPSIYDALGTAPGSEQPHEEDTAPLDTVQMKERTTEEPLRWQAADLGLETLRPRQCLSPCKHLTVLTCCYPGLQSISKVYL